MQDLQCRALKDGMWMDSHMVMERRQEKTSEPLRPRKVCDLHFPKMKRQV